MPGARPVGNCVDAVLPCCAVAAAGCWGAWVGRDARIAEPLAKAAIASNGTRYPGSPVPEALSLMVSLPYRMEHVDESAVGKLEV